MKTITLTKGQVTIVDDTDYDLLCFHWYALFNGSVYYAARNESMKVADRTLLMHRVIAERMGLNIVGIKVDHWDGDSLNNRRMNIRPATHTQNMQNCRPHKPLSGYKGVSACNIANKWRARITVSRKEIIIGYYDTPEDAAHAYDERALELFGEFARLNFPK